MTDRHDNKGRKLGENFEEAIAHHQLELQTELKKTTSLPSAMFDASDPMLEARLCEATESIFRCLLELDVPEHPDEDGDNRRLEGVTPAELHELLTTCRQGTFDDDMPALDDGLSREFAVILADTCSRGYGGPATRAAQLLRRDTSAMLHDIGDLTRAIATHISGNEQIDEPDDFEALCHRVATAVIHSTYSPRAQPDDNAGGQA